MRLLILMIILLPVAVVHAQNELMVAAKSGVYVRDSAATGSKALCSVAFGEMVTILGSSSQKVVVDGMNGYWYKVKRNSCTGYVFNAYLTQIQKRDKRFPDHYPQFLHLGVNCGESRYFDKDLFWYSVVDHEDSYELLRDTVVFSVSPENRGGDMYDHYLNISVTRAGKPLFLIGLPDSIPDQQIKKPRIKDYTLFPGQSYFISSAKFVQYHIAAYGNVKDPENSHSIPPFMNLQDYKLKIIKQASKQFESQDIWSDVDEPRINEAMPGLVFVGDLNNDTVPDIILTHNPDYRYGSTYLFMSGFNNSQILQKVAQNNWETCY